MPQFYAFNHMCRHFRAMDLYDDDDPTMSRQGRKGKHHTPRRRGMGTDEQGFQDLDAFQKAHNPLREIPTRRHSDPYESSEGIDLDAGNVKRNSHTGIVTPEDILKAGAKSIDSLTTEILAATNPTTEDSAKTTNVKVTTRTADGNEDMKPKAEPRKEKLVFELENVRELLASSSLSQEKIEELMQAYVSGEQDLNSAGIADLLSKLSLSELVSSHSDKDAKKTKRTPTENKLFESLKWENEDTDDSDTEVVTIGKGTLDDPKKIIAVFNKSIASSSKISNRKSIATVNIEPIVDRGRTLQHAPTLFEPRIEIPKMDLADKRELVEKYMPHYENILRVQQKKLGGNKPINLPAQLTKALRGLDFSAFESPQGMPCSISRNSSSSILVLRSYSGSKSEYQHLPKYMSGSVCNSRSSSHVSGRSYYTHHTNSPEPPTYCVGCDTCLVNTTCYACTFPSCRNRVCKQCCTMLSKHIDDGGFYGEVPAIRHYWAVKRGQAKPEDFVSNVKHPKKGSSIGASYMMRLAEKRAKEREFEERWGRPVGGWQPKEKDDFKGPRIRPVNN